jgi:hypothetical protein
VGGSRVAEWVVIVGLALALAALIGYARGEPGDDGRAPDPEAVLIIGGG